MTATPLKLHHTHIWTCSICQQKGAIYCHSDGPEKGYSITARIQIQHMRKSTWCKFNEDLVKVKRVNA